MSFLIENVDLTADLDPVNVHVVAFLDHVPFVFSSALEQGVDALPRQRKIRSDTSSTISVSYASVN
jgi:hypothetical protein